MMSSDRRLHERRLIEEILGERYEPHMSERSPDAPEEDPSTIEARKRADALGQVPGSDPGTCPFRTRLA
jgi:hypothetical protein